MSVDNTAGDGRRLTGGTVLACLVTFFVIVAVVNGIMIRFAISTFGGLETSSSYQAGLTFKQDESEARAQEDRHWQVKADLRAVGGNTLIEIDARDPAGNPLTGLEASALLQHPTDARHDRKIVLSENATGHFRGTTDPEPGQWDVMIELSRGGERLFRSRNRVVLH